MSPIAWWRSSAITPKIVEAYEVFMTLPMNVAVERAFLTLGSIITYKKPTWN